MPQKLILFLNGPNANLYGLDPSGAYGPDSFETLGQRCHAAAEKLGLGLEFRQSNHEGVLVDWIQQAHGRADGIVINAASYSYTSIAILDALLAFDGPIIEAHMSNLWKREEFRHKTYISKAATGVIAGLGGLGYELAIMALANLITARETA